MILLSALPVTFDICRETENSTLPFGTSTLRSIPYLSWYRIQMKRRILLVKIQNCKRAHHGMGSDLLLGAIFVSNQPTSYSSNCNVQYFRSVDGYLYGILAKVRMFT